MMASQRGQLFSLDIILGAVLFTLVLGLLLGQSELWISSQHQSRETAELHAMSLLASNALVSNPILSASDGVGVVNLRCAPAEWAAHNDISWVENCAWFDSSKNYSISSSGLGIPAGYGFLIAFSNPPFVLPSGQQVPANKAFASVDRNMLIFASNPSAGMISSCFVNGCPNNIQSVRISVWRDS